MSRGRAYRRKQAARSRRHTYYLASINAPSHGIISLNKIDMATIEIVDRRVPKRYRFQKSMQYCKRELRRCVRRAECIGNRSAYKKHFDIDNTIW